MEECAHEDEIAQGVDEDWDLRDIFDWAEEEEINAAEITAACSAA